MEPLARRLGPVTATLAMIASMVGVGAFTTTGFLVRDIGSPPAILLAWALGGAYALAGALCYAELAAALPDNGGEYHLLTRVFGPAVGFLAGWVSLIVGFSAPAAATALACARYLAVLWPGLPVTSAAVALLLAMAALHGVRVLAGSRAQNLATALQVLLIAALAVAGVLHGDAARLRGGDPPLAEAALSADFAVGMIYVAFSYSGWNAAVYLAGEIETPERTLPRACVLGTLAVVVLYLVLNATFLMAAPAAALAGKVEVGAVAADHVLGAPGRGLVVAVVALGLLTSLSALTMTGPRVYEAMGRDHAALATLHGRDGEGGGPRPGIALQTAVALALALLSDVDQLITYVGFTLTLCSALVGVGVLRMRRREPDLSRPYRTPGYPLTPLAFVAASAWIVVHALLSRPASALAGLATLATGALVYVWVSRRSLSRRDAPGP
jgi:APA family basic amino acid/polyamine antiporter